MSNIIAIVGRPNVGKSTFLNTVVGRRVSIVDPIPGVTRDRVSIHVNHQGRLVELVDTGGIGIIDSDELSDQIEQQIDFALHTADVFVFMVDVREGVVPLDLRVAERLRKLDKPLVLAANKADTAELEEQVGEFYSLGLGDPIAISAQGRFNTTAVMDAVLSLLPPLDAPGEDELGLKLAIVGKPNAGKSTLLNTLAREERVIVSEIPGTTRDSVDVRLEWDGEMLIAIDTAGIKKRSQVQGSIAFYGQMRAERSIRRANVVLFLIDSSTDISQVDRKIGSIIRDAKKPCVLVINKWDIARARDLVTDDYLPYIAENMPGLQFAPLVFISAQTGDKVMAAMRLARQMYNQAATRVPTGPLNRVVEQAWKAKKPKVKRSRLPKIYYATQVGVHPPTIVLFVNDPSLFSASYARYLGNQLRKELPYAEVPIQILFRKSGEQGVAEKIG